MKSTTIFTSIVTFLFDIKLVLLIVEFKSHHHQRRCDSRVEVFANGWCYRLIRVNESSFGDDVECESSTGGSKNNVECILHKLIKLYTLSPWIDERYEFTTLKQPTSSKPATMNIWRRLVQKTTATSSSSSSVEMRILISQFRLNESTFVEGTRIDADHPNLMIHEDTTTTTTTNTLANETTNSGRRIKCILGHHIENDNQSFTFKYSSCNRKLPFICTKPIYRTETTQTTTNYRDVNNKQPRDDDRCHVYRRHYPGGNWIECDKLEMFVSSSMRMLRASSRKCCLFDLTRRETFERARAHCAKFNSFVYSFKSKAYKKILENYADYLSSNYPRKIKSSITTTTTTTTMDNDEDDYHFWTSCRLEDDDQNIKCDSSASISYNNARTSLDSWRSSSSLSSQGPGLFFSYVLVKNQKFRLNYLNMSLLAHFNQSQPDGEKLFSHLAGDYFLMSRRKPDRHSRLKVYTTTTNDCFRFESSSPSVDTRLVYLSIPYLKNCFHFLVISSSNRSNQLLLNYNTSLDHYSPVSAGALDHQTLSGVLKSLGILEFSLCSGSASIDANCSLLNATHNSSMVIRIIVRKLFRSTKIASSWLHRMNELLAASQPHVDVVVDLYGTSRIWLSLESSCHDRWLDLVDLLDECLSFYDRQYCLFRCPDDCEFADLDPLWQIERFEYLNSSIFCKAARHANIKFDSLGKLIAGRDYNRNTTKGAPILLNNLIQSQFWPPMGIDPSYFDSTLNFTKSFKFENSSIESTRQQPKQHDASIDSFVLVKSLHSIRNSSNSSKIPFILMTNYSTLVNISLAPLLLPSSLELLMDEETRLEFRLSKQSWRGNSTLAELEIDGLISNNYFELSIDAENDKNFSIQFPVNFKSELFDLSRLSTVVLNKPQLAIPNQFKLDSRFVQNSTKNSSRRECFWHINDMSTEIPCSIEIGLSSNSIDFSRVERHMSYIIHPLVIAENVDEIHQFSRVLISNWRLSNCTNLGMISSNADRCTCWPGFTGIWCEQPCPRGHFGLDCQYSCPNMDCSGYLICAGDPIGCQCASGLDPAHGCGRPCAANKWGPDCSNNCLDCPHHICDRVNGKCLNDCENNSCSAASEIGECRVYSRVVEFYNSSYFVQIFSSTMISSGRNLTCIKNLNNSTNRTTTCAFDLNSNSRFSSFISVGSNDESKLINGSMCELLKNFDMPCLIRGIKQRNGLFMQLNGTCYIDVEIFIVFDFESLTRLYVYNQTINLLEIKIEHSESPALNFAYESAKEIALISEPIQIIVALRDERNRIILVDSYFLNRSYLENTEIKYSIDDRTRQFQMFLYSLIFLLAFSVMNKCILDCSGRMAGNKDFFVGFQF